jgi:hypothetical protein
MHELITQRGRKDHIGWAQAYPRGEEEEKGKSSPKKRRKL